MKLGTRPFDVKHFTEAIGQAPFASKIIAYAQVFNLIQAGSQENGWGIAPGVAATVWRGACIIRAGLLERIK